MTNRDQLNRLKEPYRTQAFENYKSKSINPFRTHMWLNLKSQRFTDSLKLAFSWKRSPQGDDYWLKIYMFPQNYLQDENTNEA